MAVGNNIGGVYTANIGGQTFQVAPASQGGYMNAYAQYETDRTNQLNVAREQLDKTLKQNNETTNANYDNSARQAYVQYMQRQRSLPGQLQRLGVNGGATESGLLNLYNNYGSAHAANEQQRNADLTTNQQKRDDAYNDAYQAYLSDLNEQKQQAMANQIAEYDNEITRFSSSVAQYPSTKAGYKSYETWINNLAVSGDPLKDIKIALVRQQMASQFPNGNPGSSGSSSKKSSGGSSKKSGGGSKKNNNNSKKSGGGGGSSSSARGGYSDNSVGSYYVGSTKNKSSSSSKKYPTYYTGSLK